MKTNRKHEVIARIARRSSALAALLVLVLSAAGISRAQSQSAAPKSAAASATAPAKIAVVETATVAQTATAKPALGPAAPAGQSTPKGQQEGIKVHGHWTIEVKNPDGTVVTHREFENSLQTSGVELLENVLLGNYTPQAYQIVLVPLGVGQVAPCLGGPGGPGNLAVFQCIIQEDLPTLGNNACQPIQYPAFQLFCTLTRMPALGTYATSVGPMTFQGSFTASAAGYIGAVALQLVSCINASDLVPTGNMLSPISPADCSGGNYSSSPTTSVAVRSTAFTATTLGTAVQVTAAGQTVSVSVQINFSSGN